MEEDYFSCNTSPARGGIHRRNELWTLPTRVLFKCLAYRNLRVTVMSQVGPEHKMGPRSFMAPKGRTSSHFTKFIFLPIGIIVNLSSQGPKFKTSHINFHWLQWKQEKDALFPGPISWVSWRQYLCLYSYPCCRSLETLSSDRSCLVHHLGVKGGSDFSCLLSCCLKTKQDGL